MFTIKLYSDGKSRIAEAEGFTVYWYNDYAAQITAHRKDPSDDRAFYVGDSYDVPAIVVTEVWYDRAIIENGNGKTTEFVQPAPSPPRAGAQQCSWPHQPGYENSGSVNIQNPNP